MNRKQLLDQIGKMKVNDSRDKMVALRKEGQATAKKFQSKHGRPPTLAELSKEVGYAEWLVAEAMGWER